MKRWIAAVLALLLVLTLIPSFAFADEEEPAGAEVHFNYLDGSSDGRFHPTATMTRAEMAQMIYRIRESSGLIFPRVPSDETEVPVVEAEAPVEETEVLIEETQVPDEETDSSAEETEAPTEAPTPFAGFPDVPDDKWYTEAVNAIGESGVMTGMPDGCFHPNDPVHRSELIQVVAVLSGIKGAEDCLFSDISPDHWAYIAVCIAQREGWICGFPDGTCRPNALISRAEAVVILNNFLGRSADEKYINAHPTARYFPDVQPGSWYYYAVTEATACHTADRIESGERWQSHTDLPLYLNDGFYLYGDRFILVENGTFVTAAGEGTYNGISYTGDGAVLELIGTMVLDLGDGSKCIVKNGTLCTARGFFDFDGDLFYIQADGTLLCSGTHRTMLFDADGRYTSGNLLIDAFADAIIGKVTDSTMTKEQKLRACYDYVQAHIVYQSNNNHVPRGADESLWTEQYMLRLMERGKGNCFCFASEMYYLARALGYYQARAISGGGSMTGSDLDHGWLEIEVDGIRYLFDPEVNWKYAKNQPGAYFKKRYGTTRFIYFPPF